MKASKGVQAQTQANWWLAFEANLHIIPALNKIDLITAQPKVVKQQLKQLFDHNEDEILMVSLFIYLFIYLFIHSFIHVEMFCVNNKKRTILLICIYLKCTLFTVISKNRLWRRSSPRNNR
jgi:translation elongation factor EF-G